MAQITLNSSGVASNGSLVLQSNGTTAAVTVDTAQNVGVGVTPSAWSGWGVPVLQLSTAGTVISSNQDAYFGANLYYSSSVFKYNSSNNASYYSQNSGAHKWFTAASGTAGNTITFTQAMTLDSSGNLAVGTSSPLARLHGEGTGTQLRLTYSGVASYNFKVLSPNAFTIDQDGTERLRIDSSGNLLVGKTSVDNNPGIALRPTGEGYFVRSGADVLSVNRLSTDGQLVVFYQDTVPEGNISVSGTTVSYNGGHLSRYAQTTTAKDDTLVKGTVLSNLDEMNVYTDDEGNPVDNEQLNKVKVSDVEGDVNVAGVFVNWTHDEQHNIDEINMAMTGDMIIRIAQGVTVVRGDLLMSAGNGTAKPQGDDIVRSKTIAKVTSNHVTCTYADGSYCVPCVLMAC